MDLKVSVPESFKQALSKRFDDENKERAMNFYKIEVDCPLCKTYSHLCAGCPFSAFKDKDRWGRVGCADWIENLLKEEIAFKLGFSNIRWHQKNDGKVKDQLLRLRQGAERLIQWT